MNQIQFSQGPIILSNPEMQLDFRQVGSNEANTIIQNSSLAFRDLVKSLRKKYKNADIRNQPQTKQSEQKNNHITSEIQLSQNPQQESILSKNQHKSEEGQMVLKNSFITDRHSFRFKLDESQEALKLKPKGSINGRDSLQNSPLKLNSSFHSHYISKPQFSPKANKRSKIMQQKISGKRYLALNTSSFLPKIQKIQKQKQKNQDIMEKSSRSSNFRQHKLNSKMAKSIKITQIKQMSILQYCKMQYLSEKSQAKQIFSFFNQLCRMVNYYIDYPLIKKYQNCVYFGRPIINQQKYQGFLYYFDRKIFYGEFLNGQRSGQGIQVNFQSDIIFKGTFQDGMKTGKFQVNKPEQKYIGQLVNGAYHGLGKLITKDSIYEGNFRDGEKHGLGIQVFPKTGLKLNGNFYHNFFDTKNYSSDLESVFNKSKRLSHEQYSDSDWKRGFSQGIQYEQRFYESRQLQANRMQHQSNFCEDNPQVYNIKILTTAHKKSQSQPINRISNNQLKYMNNVTTRRIANQAQFTRASNDFNLNDKNTYRMSQIIPKGYQQFDHSFDIYSRHDTQLSSDLVVPTNRVQGTYNKRKRHQHSGNLQMIQQRMETAQLEDPLPMPAFLK